MVQLYFFSVLCNFLSGLVLASPYLSRKLPALEQFGEIPDNRPKLTSVLGIVTILTALLKFGTVLSGDVPVVGDLFPALTGIWLGASLTYRGVGGSVSSQQEGPSGNIDTGRQSSSNVGSAMGRIFGFHPEIMGLAGIAFAIIHFLFPRVVLI